MYYILAAACLFLPSVFLVADLTLKAFSACPFRRTLDFLI